MTESFPEFLEKIDSITYGVSDLYSYGDFESVLSEIENEKDRLKICKRAYASMLQYTGGSINSYYYLQAAPILLKDIRDDDTQTKIFSIRALGESFNSEIWESGGDGKRVCSYLVVTLDDILSSMKEEKNVKDEVFESLVKILSTQWDLGSKESKKLFRKAALNTICFSLYPDRNTEGEEISKDFEKALSIISGKDIFDIQRLTYEILTIVENSNISKATKVNIIKEGLKNIEKGVRKEFPSLDKYRTA